MTRAELDRLIAEFLDWRREQLRRAVVDLPPWPWVALDRREGRAGWPIT